MAKVHNAQGFTLTELLISVIIIAVGVVGFISAVGVASTELWIGQRDTEVSLLLADQAERLKSLPPDSVVSGSRSEGDYQLSWQVVGTDPKQVVLEAMYARHDAGQRADTVFLLLSR